MGEVKVSELQGAALDWAVARAEGYSWHLERGAYGSGFHVVVKLPEPCVERLVVFRPSSDWGQGGPLIEKRKVWLSPPSDCEPVGWDADVYAEDGSEGFGVRTAVGCDTALIAACRAIVAAKLGDVVSIPEELME